MTPLPEVKVKGFEPVEQDLFYSQDKKNACVSC